MLLQTAEPIWQSIGFYCCLFTALIIIVVAAYNHRITQLKKMTEVRLRISRDLHDDIGSTLSSISLMSKMASGNGSAKAKPDEVFATIGTASSQAMDLMSDIVWSVNPENDKMTNVISRIREYGSSMLEAADISFRIEAGADLERMNLPMEKRKDVYLIYKEAVNNLAKYSQATEALVKLSCEKELLTLQVKDNGRGFDMRSVHSGNGLKNMEARAARLKAAFKITSAQGNGTSMTLTLPLY
jgi:signal transduction histidine kinase